ncbi:MAG: DNA replication and repair protein RecF [Acidobacteriota bacterium]
MILRTLTVTKFRNLAEAAYDFHPQVNIFTGENGQGKTNLLEAIYFLSTTRSFRTTHLVNLPRFEEGSFFVQGTLEREGVTRTISAGLQFTPDRKRELRLNDQPVTLQKYVSAIQLFAYSSSRLEILRGGPEERRRFIDRGITSLHPGHIQDISRYSRALQQRNALLQKLNERRASLSLLDSWDAELAAAATPIFKARQAYTTQLLRELNHIVSAHNYHVRDLEMRYQPGGMAEGDDAETLLETLRANRKREIAAGFTLAGPHRDNLLFELRRRPAVEVLSSGELKMVILFLKFAKIHLYRARFDEQPLFLLDDVDAELDLGIIGRLLAYITGTVQIFATSAKQLIFESLDVGPRRTFHLLSGRAAEVAEKLP